MRIDSLANIQAAIRTNVAELMGRLETGDVIKAKVLEITSGEIILRLFDGSMLKAAAGEDLQAKVGQTLTLTVTSKSEGSLFLETLKDQSQLSSIKPEILKSLLAALDVKSNPKNLELAAEFMKAGISPTADQFEKASALMKDYKGFNAEKAVFMSSKGIQSDQVKLELLTKLLDGDLKLGEQLKDLQSALESVAKSAGKPAAANSMINAFLDAAASALAEKAINNAGAAAQKSSTTNTSTGASPSQSNTTSSQQNKAASLQSQAGGNDSTSVTAELPKSSNTAAGTVNSAAINRNSLEGSSANVNTAQSAVSQEKAMPLTQPGPASAANSTPDAANTPVIDQKEAAAAGKSLNTGRNAISIDTPSEEAVFTRGAVTNPDGTVKNAGESLQALADNAADSLNKPGSVSDDPFSKLKDAIKELFVQLDPDKSSAGPELSKSHRELNDKLDLLRSAIQNSGLAGLSGGDGITAAANLIDDSVKLLNQLNNSSVLYYQLPVNLSGQNTTAELYIMKRDQNKKRIDPHNSVMFISLNTNHLGRFETLIDVKGNNVTINFRTEKQEINDFVKENIKHLYSGLSESGYKLADIRYALIDSATPPIKLEQILSKMLESNRSKVDMRI